jgi:hypothetical protein
MPNLRRIRDRIYQRKRRLRRLVFAGKLTPDQMEIILTAYAIRHTQEKNERQD